MNTNLSYLRTGNVGGKKIKKILSIDSRNNNITLLDQKLLDIKTMIEDGSNIFVFDEHLGHSARFYFHNHKDEWNEDLEKRCGYVHKDDVTITEKKVLI